MPDLFTGMPPFLSLWFFPPTRMLLVSAETGFGIHSDTKGKPSRIG
jgi:hypothetical protein